MKKNVDNLAKNNNKTYAIDLSGAGTQVFDYYTDAGITGSRGYINNLVDADVATSGAGGINVYVSYDGENYGDAIKVPAGTSLTIDGIQIQKIKVEFVSVATKGQVVIW